MSLMSVLLSGLPPFVFVGVVEVLYMERGK
jgi:hypothetical protein